MTDEVANANPSEPNASTNAEVSKNEQDLSQQSQVTREELDSLRSEIRGLQGGIDKNAQKTTNKISEFEERLSSLGIKLTPAQKLEMRLENLESGQSVSPVSEPIAPVSYLATVFQKAGITSPTAEQFELAKTITDPVDLTVALLSGAKPVSSGVLSTGSLASSPNVDKYADANAEIEERLKTIRRGDIRAIALAKREVRDKYKLD
jgi:hypothetical protein